MKRLFCLIVISLIFLPVVCNGGERLDSRLNSGLRNNEPAAYLFIEQARANRTEAAQALQEAAKESPDLPAVYFELARASFSFSSAGIFASIENCIEGILAYARNFWSSFTLAGSLFVSAFVSLICAIALIVIIRLPGDINLLAHNIAETRYLLSLLGLLLVVSVISPLLFLAVILVMLGIYMNKIDRVVVYGFLVFLVLSPLFFRATTLFLQAQSSPRMKAIVAVNESKDNRYALATLQNADDYASLYSYALALKREGRYDDAVAVYERLLQQRLDPKVYVNLGNCYVGLRNMEAALSSYQKAVEIKPLASAYYNLSQISRELLDYARGNEYFNRALAIDRNAISDFRAIYSRNPNRIVVDETLSHAALWGLALTDTVRPATLGISVLPPFLLSGAAILLIILFVFLMNSMRNRAYRCNRCSAILCPQCEKTLARGAMCQTCYASFVKLDKLEAKERVAKLLSIYDHQKRRRTFMKIFSFLAPGCAQLYAGRILVGFLLLWPFLFCLFIPFTNRLLAGGGALYAHSLFSWAAVFCAVSIYSISNIITRQRIAKGWL